jgi:transposase
LLLKNPWNLNGNQKDRLSTLVRWNTPLVRAWYLKEAFQLFWEYKQPKRAKDHLEKWMRSAMTLVLATSPAPARSPRNADSLYRRGAPPWPRRAARGSNCPSW